MCRTYVSKIEKKFQDEKDEREAILAENCRRADLEQIIAKVEKDLKTLDHLSQPDDKKNEEHALDMKYLRERQQKLGKHHEF